MDARRHALRQSGHVRAVTLKVKAVTSEASRQTPRRSRQRRHVKRQGGHVKAATPKGLNASDRSSIFHSDNLHLSRQMYIPDLYGLNSSCCRQVGAVKSACSTVGQVSRGLDLYFTDPAQDLITAG